MKGYNVYSKVHQMREAGFSQRAIAKALGINRKTVKGAFFRDLKGMNICGQAFHKKPAAVLLQMGF